MVILAVMLHWAFVISQTSTLLILSWRSWWMGAPAFMAFLFLTCVQSISSLAGYPHPGGDKLWWHFVWAPVEVAILVAAIGAGFEVLFKRTSYAHGVERISMRIWCPLVAFSLVKFRWSAGEYQTMWGWFIYVREFAWVGLALMLGIMVTFFLTPSQDSKVEPRTLATHSQVLFVLFLSHALIAPLARRGCDPVVCQQIYMAISTVCCCAWVTLCSPAVSKYAVRIHVGNVPSHREKPSHV